MTTKASNRNLRQHVLDEPDGEATVDATNVGIAVNDGFVTLGGHVPCCAPKRVAERAALRVADVKSIADAARAP